MKKQPAEPLAHPDLPAGSGCSAAATEDHAACGGVGVF